MAAPLLFAALPDAGSFAYLGLQLDSIPVMDSENRNKRDLPEVVADILITLDKVQQDIHELQEGMHGLKQEMHGLQQQMNNGFDRMESAFNNMTTAVLDAMNRQTDRYDRTADAHGQQQTEIRELKQRVDGLEKTVYNKAS